MSNKVKRMNSTKVVTGVVRLSYANVWKPKSINGGAEKYSVSLIIHKSDTKTLSAINEAVNAAIEEGKSKFGGKIPNKAALKLHYVMATLIVQMMRLMQIVTLSMPTAILPHKL